MRKAIVVIQCGLVTKHSQQIPCVHFIIFEYHETSDITRSAVDNKIADHSDVVGSSPVGAAPTTSLFWTEHLASIDWAKTTAKWDENHLSFGIWCDLCIKGFTVCLSVQVCTCALLLLYITDLGLTSFHTHLKLHWLMFLDDALRTIAMVSVHDDIMTTIHRSFS